MKKAKYKNTITTVDGIKFHSAKEARRYITLSMLQRLGKISDLELQPVFPVKINGVKVFTYKADFGYVQGENPVVEDVKGFRTPMYRLKKKCVEASYGIEIREV